ncbi:MAG: class I SAM-dependent methyltransferase [Chitinophagaceae bacterium]
MWNHFLNTLRYRRIANQLRRPHGAGGLRTAAVMNRSNEHLYNLTIEAMQLKGNESILEIGFGNGMFFEKLLSKDQNLQLAGIDFSKTMVSAASEKNKPALAAGRLSLFHGNSKRMPFADENFNRVFCINVIYFWDKPSAHLSEIFRVLKPGGLFYATARTSESLEKMPFTRYGFRKYRENEWKKCLEENGFSWVGTLLTDDPPADKKEKSALFRSACFIAEKK